MTALAAVVALAQPASSEQTEPIQTRAHDIYVTAMRAVGDGFEAATAIAEARGEFGMACPVPSATFVSSFGAPRTGHTHQGVDMMADFDTPILAPEAGVYEQHGSESFYLFADSGTTYFGTHLGGHIAPSGRVTRGQPISTVSNTGNASGGSPHLHFEIHPGGGEAVDPYPATYAACYAPVVAARAAPNMNAIPTFRYGVMEIHRWWNAEVQRITSRQARTLTLYFNVIVGNRLARYIDAISGYGCAPGDPAACEALVRSTAVRYGVDPAGAVNVARCESGLNPDASNGGRYLGLFQQSATYWPGRAAQYGFAGRSAFDPVANASVSLMMVSDGGWGPWECQP